ncbi:hypothetical protein RJ640_030382 [Escallonia rubra]|uniref:Beta-glucosidase 12-like n=1 Tax=Escallonia rubra TaxID=112253 RepID=A0AA88UB69_9ASTE|nr:hypothetical protein RJ640_030382 [Escallonia rubra]
MGIEGYLFLGLLFFAYALSSNEAHPGLNRAMALVEGAWNEDGKGLKKIKDRSNGDMAVDSYHRYKLGGGVNEAGIKYYDNLINELLANGLQPYVTIFHWDVPQALQEAYGGFLSPKIVNDFQDYANLCFKRFGDRVRHWITLNEPWTLAVNGHDYGTIAPGRCSTWRNYNCTGGDSATEPYLVTHHQILAHAAAAKLYRTKYKPTQNGIIGITLVTKWMVPASNSSLDIQAALRAQEFFLGWYMDPLVFGDYSHLMKRHVGARLPRFTAEQSNLVKGSLDYLGLNYYTANYAAHVTNFGNDVVNVSYTTDNRANLTTSINGVPIGEKAFLHKTVLQAGSDWLYVYPQGIKEALLYIKKNYNNPIIYITENGKCLIFFLYCREKKLHEYNGKRLLIMAQFVTLVTSLVDREGVNVKGFFTWAVMDNFEWDMGYTSRFGLNYVDFTGGLKRYPKLSAEWLTNFLKK